MMTHTFEQTARPIDEAVARLQDAARTMRPCAPVRDLIGGDADLAYAVQRAIAAQRLARGARVVGHKIGLTSPAVQAQLGVDRPDFGLLFDDMDASGASVDISKLLQPKVEAEVAFVLREDLTDPRPTAHGVRSAVDYAVAALEIVDSRIAGWDITFADTVADNASSGLFVLGNTTLPLSEFEPVEATMTMTIDGEIASSGDGAACLGDPLNALAWLAATAVSNGNPLRRGQVVLSGALGPMAVVTPNCTVRAVIGALGAVETTFTLGGAA